jgi:hypothetical protein
LRGLRIAAIACLKRERTMLGFLAEPDRLNATTLRDPAASRGATSPPPSAPFLDAAWPIARRCVADGDGYRTELASD